MNHNEEEPENLGGLGDLLPTEVLQKVNELLEQLHWTDHTNQGSKIEFVYVASGGQHVDTQINIENPPKQPTTNPEKEQPTPIATSHFQRENPFPKERESADRIRHCIALLMEEKYGNKPLFNTQSHWQAVYRILVDKEYCRDSDFDGFDAFIQTVMPEKVNKPYTKASVKQISQTDFVKPFKKWTFDHQTSKTRKPFDRMVTVAQRFLDIMEENRL